jgi:N-succinyldiaminopimelate aminotransferase
MNPDLDLLQPYPFEKLAALKTGLAPPADLPHISLSIGEPKHPTPDLLKSALIGNLGGLANYPATKGGDALRQAIADWLVWRFALPGLDPARQVLPVNGTREALFAFAQAVVDRSRPHPLVLMPNPFYQIYEGAALLAGAQPWFINCREDSGFLPDYASVPDDVWARCQLLYLCSPGNPTGAVASLQMLQMLLRKAEEFDFVIASDECYSELYLDEARPPPGLLQAAAALGDTDYRRCLVFHSLSKRSSAPGLRSGFVAGDANLLEKFLLYRTYHGCAMPPPVQAASAAAWRDEAHVAENRRLYREKFQAFCSILEPVWPLQIPPASFYLWAKTPIEDTAFARELFAREHLTVLPGSYLSRPAHGIDPGRNRVRIALVADTGECLQAAGRIRRFIETR